MWSQAYLQHNNVIYCIAR